jgi:hypothetical protein
MGGAYVTRGKDGKCIKNLVEEPEGKRKLGRLRSRLEDNIKIDLNEIE